MSQPFATDRPRPVMDQTVEIRVPRPTSQSRRIIVPKARRDPVAIGVAIVATLLSVAACVHFYRSHQLLGYQDAYSHLEISRRILVGRTTGIAQLGAIWLPLPHILQAAFAWNSTLYTTGLAGAFVSMIAYVTCSTLIYRIVRVFSPLHAWPALAAAAVFMTDANVLYQQTTAMDEMPFFAFALLATDGLVRWADTKRAGYLLRAAVACMLAMLCRYEAWFLGGMFTIAVLIMARRMGYSWRDVRGLTGLFATFSVATAAGGWLLYNWVIAGSPLNFLYGPNSSSDQMSKRNTDVEIGSWSKTLRAYASVVVSDHGILILAAAAVGLVVLVMVDRFSARSLPILALTSVIPFFILTIYRGQEPVGIPPVNQYLLNVRFGLIVALSAALFIGYLCSRLSKPFAIGASLVVIIGVTTISADAFAHNRLVTVKEATEDFSAQSVQAQTGDFLKAHTTGPVLINLVGNERVAFPILDRVIYEGTKIGQTNIWTLALRDPHAVEAQVIVMRNSPEHGADDTYFALHGKPALAGYQLIYSNVDYTVYELGGRVAAAR